jgi:alpha-tubulin suppressor-like RCC1 family protein
MEMIVINIFQSALVGVKVTMVSCGEYHTVVCTEDGHMYIFGEGEEGKLGHGDEENKSSPAGLGGETYHTSAILSYHGFDVKWLFLHMGGCKG